MKTKTLLISLFISFISQTANAEEYSVTGPYSNKNLSIYLIHGEDKIKDQTFVTLGDAMKDKVIKVHETSNVNQLSIENISQDKHIYIQAGDIVRGGKQDRVFSTDMVLEPKSGIVKIASFCVEQGRWSKRGNESSKEFNSSTKKLSSKKLKLAARLNNDQSEVWAEVAKEQRKLSVQVGADVKSNKSNSSLQLTLENKKIAKRTLNYKNKFISLLKGKKKTIGYAFSVNGELNSVDIYAKKELLNKLWPKIIDAAATEAVSEFKNTTPIKKHTSNEILNWIQNVKKDNLNTKTLKTGLMQDTFESATDVRFDTYSLKGDKKYIYRQNIIKK